MTELRSTATSGVFANEGEAFAGERRFIGRPEEAPASGGLRAGFVGRDSLEGYLPIRWREILLAPAILRIPLV